MKINYAEEMSKCRPALYRFMLTGDEAELRADLQCSSANTVHVFELIMFAGRDAVYDPRGRWKPYKHPDKVLRDWARSAPSVKEENKQNEIEYMLAMIDLYTFLKRGMQVLGI